MDATNARATALKDAILTALHLADIDGEHLVGAFLASALDALDGDTDNLTLNVPAKSKD